MAAELPSFTASQPNVMYVFRVDKGAFIICPITHHKTTRHTHMPGFCNARGIIAASKGRSVFTTVAILALHRACAVLNDDTYTMLLPYNTTVNNVIP